MEYITREHFDAWMERLSDKLDNIGKRMTQQEKSRNRLDGENLFDNQDICLLLKISKRSLQRYRSEGKLSFIHIRRKIYYKESDVHKFIREYVDFV